MEHKKTLENTKKHKKHIAGGNTKSPAIRSRKWCFTLNNYNELDLKNLVSVLETRKHRYIIGEEIGEQGTPHLQGYIEGTNAISFDTLCKWCPKGHYEPCKGSTKQNVNYCSKDGKFHTNINVNKYIDKIEYCLNLQYKEVKWKPFQQDIIERITSNEPDDRKINWFYDINGNVGKSFLCKYIALKFENVIISEGKKDNVYNQVLTLYSSENYDITKRMVIILDISRHNQDFINYGCIESLKNGCIYSGKYEGGTCIFPPPFVFIFSNCEPDYEKWSEDRYNVKNI